MIHVHLPKYTSLSHTSGGEEGNDVSGTEWGPLPFPLASRSTEDSPPPAALHPHLEAAQKSTQTPNAGVLLSAIPTGDLEWGDFSPGHLGGSIKRMSSVVWLRYCTTFCPRGNIHNTCGILGCPGSAPGSPYSIPRNEIPYSHCSLLFWNRAHGQKFTECTGQGVALTVPYSAHIDGNPLTLQMPRVILALSHQRQQIREGRVSGACLGWYSHSKQLKRRGVAWFRN